MDAQARLIGMLGLILALGACGGTDEIRAQPPEGGFAISFEDQAAPSVFEVEGEAMRGASDAAPGLWAAVPGLPRPERALIVRLEGRGRAVVSLFAGQGPPGAPILLSPEAADALGIGATAVRVRVTALRRQAEITYNRR